MSEPRSFDHQLRAWLDEGPQAAPQDLLGEVLEAAAAIPHARRVGPWRLPRWLVRPAGSPGSSARLAGLFLAAAALVVAAIGTLMTIGGPLIPRPTPTPSPTKLPPSTSIAESCLVTYPPRPNEWPSFDPSSAAGLIAYTAWDSAGVESLMVVDPARPDDKRVIASNLAFDLDPISWAPDGSALLLIGPYEPDTLPGLILYKADGTITQITEKGSGVFSPDGRSIAYAVPGEGLCVTDANGARPRTLEADTSTPFWESVAWSPDGSRLAFIDLVEDSPAHGHHAVGLSFIDSDGSNLQQLALDLGIEAPAGGLTWSPDGSTLAFSMFADGSPKIYVVNADGTNLRPLISVGPAMAPAWSPDGSQIAYSFQGQLSIINADGTDYHPVRGFEPSSAPGSGVVFVGPWFAWNPVR